MMNDEEMAAIHEEPTSTETGDPLQTLDETDGETREEGTPSPTDSPLDEATDAVSSDPVQDSDPAPSEATQAPAEDQLDSLRNELKQLRAELNARDGFLTRIGNECEEFRTLYPDTPLSALPDSVWNEVSHGVPIAAAYALFERRRALTEEKAEVYNQANEARSSGALKATDPDCFSPAEVRAMSQDEVRANYQKIMRSMQDWR